jgi:hypothetical protein
MLMRDVSAEARLLIDAKEPSDAAADSADSAPDDRADRASGSIAFTRAFSRAAHNALGAGGKRQGQEHKSCGGEKFHIHVDAPKFDFPRARRGFDGKRIESISGWKDRGAFFDAPSESKADAGSLDRKTLADRDGRLQDRKLLNDRKKPASLHHVRWHVRRRNYPT